MPKLLDDTSWVTGYWDCEIFLCASGIPTRGPLPISVLFSLPAPSSDSGRLGWAVTSVEVTWSSPGTKAAATARGPTASPLLRGGVLSDRRFPHPARTRARRGHVSFRSRPRPRRVASGGRQETRPGAAPPSPGYVGPFLPRPRARSAGVLAPQPSAGVRRGSLLPSRLHTGARTPTLPRPQPARHPPLRALTTRVRLNYWTGQCHVFCGQYGSWGL